MTHLVTSMYMCELVVKVSLIFVNKTRWEVSCALAITVHRLLLGTLEAPHGSDSTISEAAKNHQKFRHLAHS